MPRSHLKNTSTGFSLFEVLIYSALFALVSGLLIGILSVVTKISGTETAQAELVSQGDFVLKNFERIVREACDITEVSTTEIHVITWSGASCSSVTGVTKKLKWSGVSSDKITLDEGAGLGAQAITTGSVSVTSFTLKKFSNPISGGGTAATAQIDMELTYNSNSPGITSQKFHTSVVPLKQ